MIKRSPYIFFLIGDRYKHSHVIKHPIAFKQPILSKHKHISFVLFQRLNDFLLSFLRFLRKFSILIIVAVKLPECIML